MNLTEQRRLTGAASEQNIVKFDSSDVVLEARDITVRYGDALAIENISFQIPRNTVVSIIGPSGCGKSTLIRCFNRMNELIPIAQISGDVFFNSKPIYRDTQDPTEIRFRIGMVFQRPNPFPKSIYDNVAFGPRINGLDVDLDEVVERSLQRAALWDEVKDRLRESGLSLSGGQQQRLCIARALAVDPGSSVDGRAGFRARPDIDAAHRGAHTGIGDAGDHRDRHAQHAAGFPHF